MEYVEMRDNISAYLQDNTGDVWSPTELDPLIVDGLKEISFYKPREVKETIQTDGTLDLTLTTENKRNLIRVLDVEYPIGQTPKKFRNFTRRGDILTLEMDSTPGDDEDGHLYLGKKHILRELGTTDTAGAVKTTAAIAATSLTLDGLGVGTINEDSVLEIAGDDTDYTVTATTVISGNEATVYITPALVAQATADAVVTLSAPDSSLDITLERILSHLVAGRASLSKSRKYMNKVNVGAGGGLAPRELQGFGVNEIAMAMRDLSLLTGPRISRQYDRG